MGSLFNLMIALVFGLILIVLIYDRKSIIENEPGIFMGYLNRYWRYDNRIPYIFYVVGASVGLLISLSEIDMTKVDFADPVNIVILIFTLIIFTPFYLIFLPSKKKKNNNT